MGVVVHMVGAIDVCVANRLIEVEGGQTMQTSCAFLSCWETAALSFKGKGVET